MANVVSPVVRAAVGVTSALLVTLAAQGPAQASAGPHALYAEHGSDTGWVPAMTNSLYVNDVEKDGNDVVGQVWYHDSRSNSERTYEVWDRDPDGDAATGVAPGNVLRMRVCEETGSCSAWVR
ncbi:hypothetical protein ABGB14_31065 [Nonomuraea sp. B10E15]|uniref:hypothetical protein n=1 Tax=Nonomuraea sp. B10E15 TaxID=3153560 RepID=UPI00325F182A